MNIATLQLEQRISRLERVNTLLLIAVLISAAAMLMGAVKSPATIKAQSFQLVNSEGRVQAEIVARDGNPGFYIKDEHGVDRVALFHEANASGMHVMDADGVTRIGTVQFAHGGGGFALHGPESRGAAVLYFKDEGSLRFFDAEGAVTNTIKAVQAH
jgi:hypothetical protein